MVHILRSKKCSSLKRLICTVFENCFIVFNYTNKGNMFLIKPPSVVEWEELRKMKIISKQEESANTIICDPPIEGTTAIQVHFPVLSNI